MKEPMKKQRGRVITGWRHVEPPKAKRSLRKVSSAPADKLATQAAAPVAEPVSKG